MLLVEPKISHDDGCGANVSLTETASLMLATASGTASK